MTTGTIRTTYRIDELIPWSAANNAPESEWQWRMVVGPNITDHASAEAGYEELRNENPTVTLRLVMIHEHAERCGRGRVMA